MSTDEPNKRLLLAFIGVLLLGVIIFNSKPLALNPGQFELKEGAQIRDSGVIILQGNTLVASASPTFPRVQVLGVMVDEKNKEIIEKIIFCESSNRHKGIWGDLDYKYPAYGITQMQRRTHSWLAGLAGVENPDWKDKEQQIYLLDFALRKNLGHLWTCYRKVK